MTVEIKQNKIPLHFIIVGAGLGGLSAAIGLSLTGHKVTVLEQAAALGEVGAGIQIPPNSVKILERFGCKKEIKDVSTLPRAASFYKWDNAKFLSSQKLYPYCVEKYGGEYLHIHRADFHRALVNRAKELNVELILNSIVNKVDFENNKVITTEGKEYSADVIIGADGLKSKVRCEILGKLDLPHNTGDLAYRALIPVSEMKKDPELSMFYNEPNITFFWGPTTHVVVYLLDGGNICNVVVLSPDTLPEDVNVGPAEDGELDELFKNWNPKLRKLLTLVKSTSKWRLQNSVEMETWVHYTANVALMGDACHATLPYIAQGAAQAVEDAACLTEVFGNIESKDQIHDALKIFENVRKSRTTRIVKESTNCQNVYHLPDGPQQEERDRICALEPTVGCPNRWADPVFQKYLFGYDAFQEASNAWEHYKKTGSVVPIKKDISEF